MSKKDLGLHSKNVEQPTSIKHLNDSGGGCSRYVWLGVDTNVRLYGGLNRTQLAVAVRIFHQLQQALPLQLTEGVAVAARVQKQYEPSDAITVISQIQQKRAPPQHILCHDLIVLNVETSKHEDQQSHSR